MFLRLFEILGNFQTICLFTSQRIDCKNIKAKKLRQTWTLIESATIISFELDFTDAAGVVDQHDINEDLGIPMQRPIKPQDRRRG